MMRVVLGLGGNVGNSQRVFSECLGSLAAVGRIATISRLWHTRPVGPPQPDFLNAAAAIEWPAGPRSLLESCHELEAAAGRERAQEERWGPRILDLDLLMADNLVCRGPGLELPHPRFHVRRFALEPAAEVAPDWTHPLLGLTIQTLVEQARQREPDVILEVMSFEL
jgi:2-amino-4-hydroxy-6-hydroxymethyldihydropteridine diphosphokinase